MNASLRVDRARWWALSNQPFYGSLAMSLPDVFDKSVGTAATDGKVIKWNPEWIDTLSDPELRFVLLHETLHCAHQHLWRLPADERGNVAGDHEINLTLQQLSGVSMPADGLADPQYRDMSCEEILRTLPDPDPDPDGDQADSGDQADGGGGSGSGSGKPDPCGSFTEPAADDSSSSGDPAERAAANQQLRDDWESRVIQAAQAQQALGVGDLPGDMQRMLDKLRARPVDWKRELADFVHDAASSRNDWSRAARRHAWQPVIYPRRMANDIGTVVFARDTSGSVDDRTVAEYSALITECMSETGCAALVVDVDTHIRAEYELSGFDSVPLTAQGGGGTDFRPVFNRVDELSAAGQHIAGVVYLTDLQGPSPESSEIPTLWLTTDDPGSYYGAPAFGRVVRIG